MDTRAEGSPGAISQKVFEDLHDLEGNPEHRESSDDEVDVRKRPEYWGVRVRELAQFHQTIREELVAYCADHMMRFGANGCIHLCKKGSCKWGDHSGIQHQKLEDKSGASELLPNMHAVVARYVKPQTRDVGKSWALKLHPEGLRITHFITHTWEELFADFVGSLEHALDAEDVVWVCSLALDQNADIGKLLNVELSKSPFALALQRASKQLVVLDRDLKVPRRSWCAYELALATRFSMPAFLWPHPKSNIEKLKAEIKSLDLRSASASSLDDQEKILKDIQENEGYEKLNARYRSLLQLTLNFYSSAMSQVAALSAQIQEAVKGKDSEREAQLLQLVASSCGAWRRRTAPSNAVPCCRHAAEAWSRSWNKCGALYVLLRKLGSTSITSTTISMRRTGCLLKRAGNKTSSKNHLS